MEEVTSRVSIISSETRNSGEDVIEMRRIIYSH